MDFDPLHKELIEFIRAFGSWSSLRLHKTGLNIETFKNFFVDILMVRRGANTSLFIHASVLGLAVVVFVGGGVLTSTTVVSGSYPGVGVNPLIANPGDEATESGVIASEITPITIISEKPRDKVIEYEVKEGDTISSVAQEYGISPETIYWENSLSQNSKIDPGDKLKILPVSGVAHKVASGDTIYSVAKKYRASSQAMVDFPFNDISDDFQLKSGQILIVPDGAPPEKAKPAPTQYLASAKQNISVSELGSSSFIWPASGGISQYFAWYHPGLDISNLGGGSIKASDSGTVVVAGWLDASGYGNRVVIDHGNGYRTLYAHMSAVYVSPGQQVGQGEVLGAMGSTGRSSGMHLHFEVIKDGHLNPLSVLGQ